jgi:hypothetical protein
MMSAPSSSPLCSQGVLIPLVLMMMAQYMTSELFAFALKPFCDADGEMIGCGSL